MMAEARERSDWQRTSVILCMQANIARDQRERPKPFLPTDFDPFYTGDPSDVVDMDEIIQNNPHIEVRVNEKSSDRNDGSDSGSNGVGVS